MKEKSMLKKKLTKLWEKERILNQTDTQGLNYDTQSPNELFLRLNTN